MNLSELISQGGYGGYVWGAYGAVALLMVIENLILGRQRKELLNRLRRLIRMKSEENN